MTVRYVVLAEEIRSELEKLKQVHQRIQDRSQRLPEDLAEREIHLDSLALNVHSFYTGLENVFQIIASKVDGEVPSGERWHTELLLQMNTELPELRPKVVSDGLLPGLRELLAFRHLIRNIYTFNIEEEKILRICARLNALAQGLFDELEDFIGFLQTSGENS